MSQPIKVFISYAHADDDWQAKLVTQLSPLVKQGLLALWHDRCLLGGEDWAQSIDDKIRSADIVLLLVSADFIGSEYCFGIELKIALERRAKHQAKVVPIIVRDCVWDETPFSDCTALPQNRQPIASHPNPDQALAGVVLELRKLARSMQQNAVKQPDGSYTYTPLPWYRQRAFKFACGTLVFLGLCAGYQSYQALQAGRQELDLAHYDLAAAQFERASTWTGQLNRSAAFDLLLAQQGMLLVNIENKNKEFRQGLAVLQEKDKNHPWVLIFSGDLAFDEFRREAKLEQLQAMAQAYQAASQQPDAPAEAFARLAFTHELLGDWTAAEQAIQQAIAIAKKGESIPRYQDTQAEIWLQQGKTAQALAHYDGNLQHPRSAIEAAMLYWRDPARWPQAKDVLQRIKLEGADSAAAWGFILPGEWILLGRIEAQRCLQQTAQAVTQQLLTPNNAAFKEPESCQGSMADVKVLVCARLPQVQVKAWLGCAEQY